MQGETGGLSSGALHCTSLDGNYRLECPQGELLEPLVHGSRLRLYQAYAKRHEKLREEQGLGQIPPEMGLTSNPRYISANPMGAHQGSPFFGGYLGAQAHPRPGTPGFGRAHPCGQL